MHLNHYTIVPVILQVKADVCNVELFCPYLDILHRGQFRLSKTNRIIHDNPQAAAQKKPDIDMMPGFRHIVIKCKTNYLL